MHDLILLEFEGCPVRVITLDGVPWFVATDVCQILGIVNARDSVSRLDDDERRKIAVGDSDGSNINPLEVWVVNESGLYNLIFRSNKEDAKRLRKWVTSEVLPQIRRTGIYVSVTRDPILMLAQATTLMRNDQIQLEKRVKRIECEIPFIGGHWSIMAFAKNHGIGDIVSANFALAARLGKDAVKYSRVNGYEIKSVKDARWGYVGAYHEDVLWHVFAQHDLLDDNEKRNIAI